MSKIQVQTEIDLNSLLSQLKTTELEEFMRNISAVITQRKTKNKKIAEARLLKSLNENCVLPENDLLRFRMLSEKRQQQELPPEELEELFLLIEQEERLRLQRINILGELAQIKGISLLQLTNDLGLNYLESA